VKGREGIQEKQQGRDKKEVKGKNGEGRGNSKDLNGREIMRRDGKVEEKGQREAQCSRINF
jgi:hypothetical protein